MKAFIDNQRGFTLLEILLILVLIIIVSSLFYNSYFDSTRVFTFNKNRMDIQRGQDLINMWLSKYVRIAEISDGAINNIKNTVNQNTLTFNTINGDTIEYFLENGFLKISINSLSTNQISDYEFENIEFNYNQDLNFLEVSATIYNNDKDRKPYTFNNVFYPRVQN